MQCTGFKLHEVENLFDGFKQTTNLKHFGRHLLRNFYLIIALHRLRFDASIIIITSERRAHRGASSSLDYSEEKSRNEIEIFDF
jgi:hypothetical protein